MVTRFPVTRRELHLGVKRESVAIALALEGTDVPVSTWTANALIAMGIEVLRREHPEATEAELLEHCRRIITCPVQAGAEADTRGT